MSTESYIIRVYRRDAKDAGRLVGMVEVVETQEKRPFSTFDELQTILRSHRLNEHNDPPGQDAGKPRRTRP